MEAGELTRIQAHHSYAIACEEWQRDATRANGMRWRVIKSVKTGKVTRERFCMLLDLFQYIKFVGEATGIIPFPL